MTDGSASHGASVAEVANLEENSPKDRCWLFSRIRPKQAASQNAVAPPLPRTTWWPSGSENSSASPSRTRPTVSLTGACRWEVPISADPVAASASRCPVWIFDGPAPKRPSAGMRWSGIWSASVMGNLPGGAGGLA